MEDVPNLPNFSQFHDGYRDDPRSTTPEGNMRTSFFGPQLVSANFVIPYPPGFPIMVPGQVIHAHTIKFMRKLDVKEIHGYNAARGLKLIKRATIGV